MTTLIPSFDEVLKARQKPTEGEKFLLNFLSQTKHLPDDAEVFFQPCFNGDRPDVILISPQGGVAIIEVKDWNLELYTVDERNKWSVQISGRAQDIKSPFQQAFTYKKNFFDIHINGLLEKQLKNNSFFKIIRTYVYFHGATKHAIDTLYSGQLERLREHSREVERNFKSGNMQHSAYEAVIESIKNKRYKFERDLSNSLYRERLHKISFPLEGERRGIFSSDVYLEFRRLLQPPYHYATEGRSINYSEQQRKLVTSIEGDRKKICGIAGSGKTVVLAGRAVSAHKRHGGRVLILTFNSTLGSYVHDKISAIREGFSWSNFEICNYHRFITSSLNNLGVDIEIPKELSPEASSSVAARRISVARDEYLERNYYSNLALFDGLEVEQHYDTILIDEAQDYKPEWIKIIRGKFLSDRGEMLLFGDEKQNIYGRALDSERRSKVVEGFGRWISLSKSFRYVENSPIIPLVDAFQKSFLARDYEIDSDDSFQLSLGGVGLMSLGGFEQADVERLASSIVETAKARSVHPNDIAIISSQEVVLRQLDYVIRNSEAHRERTLCSFPSLESTKHPKYSKSYQKISAAKKKAFNLNSGVMKLCSTHSFKGYESPLVVLLVNKEDSPEMVFTGLTRAKRDLAVFLEKDNPYSAFFEAHLNKMPDI